MVYLAAVQSPHELDRGHPSDCTGVRLMTDSTRQVHWSGSALLAFSRVWVQVTGAILFLAISIALEPSEFGEFAIAASIYSALALIVGHGVYEYVMKMHDSP